MQVLALSGSLRAASYNTALARAAAELAPAGVRVELYDGLASLPPFDDDADGETAPAAVRDLRARAGAADALLFVTPEYNGSVPGVLKNAVDWLSRPRGEAALRGATAGVMGASTGQYGALWAQNDLRRTLGIAGARVVEGELAVPKAADRFDADGRLLDEDLRQRVAERMRALAAEASSVALAA